MKKRTIVLVLGFIVVVSGGWFTMGGFSAQPQEGTLDVWAMWAEDTDPLDALLSRYSEASGVPVRVRTGVKGDKVLKALSSAAPPDVVILSSGDLVQYYHEQGLIEPLAPRIHAERVDLDDFIPAALEPCVSPDGTLVCLPWSCEVEALLWNKGLFRAAGLDPDRPPRTMAELTEYAAKLTLRDEQGRLTQVGFVPDLSRSHTELYGRMFGGSWANQEGTELTVDAQPMVDALNWQRQFYGGPGVEETVEFVSTLDRYMDSRHPVYAGKRAACQQCHREPPGKAKTPDLAFRSGKVAMVVDGPGLVDLLTRAERELEFGIAPFPPPDGHPERANTSVVQGAVVVLSAGAKDIEAAASLLAWIMSPEIMAEAMGARARLPARHSAATDPRFHQTPEWQVLRDLAAHPNAAHPAIAPVSPELNAALSQVEREALHRGGDPCLRLGQLQAEFRHKLEQAKTGSVLP